PERRRDEAVGELELARQVCGARERPLGALRVAAVELYVAERQQELDVLLAGGRAVELEDAQSPLVQQRRLAESPALPRAPGGAHRVVERLGLVSPGDGGLEVSRELGEERAGFGTGHALDRGADPLVERRPLAGRQRAV